ncbi:chitin synthase III catalytic subunit [Morchella snyderi]|nr:chitin synthase III catalytic subunit [Morchella snyderi]
MSQFGNFHDFCRDSTLPVCNLFRNGTDSMVEKRCQLIGIAVNNSDNYIQNLGSIVLAALAACSSIGLILMSERKKAAVGRREIQIFLIGYILMSITEVFSVGGFLTNQTILVWFSALHIGAITATAWVLMLNAVVGYQLLDDGTLLSLGLVGMSFLAFFVGTTYVAVDTGFNYTGTFTKDPDSIKNYALYVLYLLFPLIMIAAYVILESVLVIKVLGEKIPMRHLTAAALSFAVGQIFNFVISVHICEATNGKIDGALFETGFTLIAVIFLWYFWSSITEDEWPEDTMRPMSEVYP